MEIEAKKKSFGKEKTLYWELTEDGTLTISGYGEMPDYLHKNDSKAPWRKEFGKIRNVVIEDGVKSIGSGAFLSCRLTSISIPPSLKSIDGYAFGSIEKIFISDLESWCNCSKRIFCSHNLYLNDKLVENIEIPNTVTVIKFGAFLDCISLRSVIIPNSVVSIEYEAFSGCTNLTEIEIPNSVKSIGGSVFWGCRNLKSLVLPNSVETIGWYAFHECSKLTNIIIPNTIKSLGGWLFEGCDKLQQISIPCKNDITVEKFAFTLKSNGYKTEKLFEGNILSMPSFMMSNPKQWGLSSESVSRYKYGIKNKDGILIIEHKDGRKVSKKTDVVSNRDYYLINEEGKKGLVDSDGKWIIQLREDIQLIELAGKDHFRVKDKNNHMSLYDSDGGVIIPTSRGYSNIGDYNSSTMLFPVSKGRYDGLCDERGREVSMNKRPLYDYEIKNKGGYSDVTQITNGNTKYYRVYKGGHYGLTDSEGIEIIPCEMDAIEPAGSGYLRYKLNGFWGLMNFTGKILIDTDRCYTSIGDFKTFNKRFAYTMNGYKGECDATGRQISKIKVETSKQSESVTKSSVQMSPTSLKSMVGKHYAIVSLQLSNEIILPLDGDLSIGQYGVVLALGDENGYADEFHIYSYKDTSNNLKWQISGDKGEGFIQLYPEYTKRIPDEILITIKEGGKANTFILKNKPHDAPTLKERK